MAQDKYINLKGLSKLIEAIKSKLDGLGSAIGTKVDKVSGKGLSTNDYTTTEKNKLAGIASGAEVNVQSDWNATSGDAFIKNKPTIPSAVTESTVSGWGFTKNTGTYSKPSAGIPYADLASGVQNSLMLANSAIQGHQSIYPLSIKDSAGNTLKTYTPNSGSATITIDKDVVGLGNVTNDAQVKRSEMGVASGVATLDANGLVPTSQLPSYVDDVLEYTAKSSFPSTGETGKIYVDTSTNKTYRWGGSAYVEISASLALGTTSSTAYRGDLGAQNATNISTLQSSVSTLQGYFDSGAAKLAKQTIYSLTVGSKTFNGSSAITITKSDLGLGNVENKSSATIRSEITKANVTSALGTGTGTTKYLREDGNWATPPNTTYSSKTAASGGTDVSLVTTGEKYTWNSKQSAISDLSTIRTNATNGATAYGWGNHASAGYQKASTAITTSNIGSQSVATATNADTVDGYHADDILPYGLENICIGAVAQGGNTTLNSDGSITTNGVYADTYFLIRCTEKLVAGQIYTMGFYVTGVPSNNTKRWLWPVASQINSNWIVVIDKNGWCWGTGTVPNDIAAGTNIIMDDSTREFYNSITISNFVIVKGKQRAYYTPPFSKKSVATTSANGLMSSSMVTQLNSAATNASNAYALAQQAVAGLSAAPTMSQTTVSSLTQSGMTFNTSYSDSKITFTKVGKMVNVQGAVAYTYGSASDGTVKICTIPSGYYPAKQFTTWQYISGNGMWRAFISSDQHILYIHSIRTASGATSDSSSRMFFINLTYVVS